MQIAWRTVSRFFSRKTILSRSRHGHSFSNLSLTCVLHALNDSLTSSRILSASIHREDNPPISAEAWARRFAFLLDVAVTTTWNSQDQILEALPAINVEEIAQTLHDEDMRTIVDRVATGPAFILVQDGDPSHHPGSLDPSTMLR